MDTGAAVPSQLEREGWSGAECTWEVSGGEGAVTMQGPAPPCTTPSLCHICTSAGATSKCVFF